MKKWKQTKCSPVIHLIAHSKCLYRNQKNVKIVHWGVKMGGKVEKNYKKFPHIIIRIRNYGANVV